MLYCHQSQDSPGPHRGDPKAGQQQRPLELGPGGPHPGALGKGNVVGEKRPHPTCPEPPAPLRGSRSSGNKNPHHCHLLTGLSFSPIIAFIGVIAPLESVSCCFAGSVLHSPYLLIMVKEMNLNEILCISSPGFSS